jgi:Rne/Rng family ribonuclease
MSTELIINASLPETRIALMERGEIQELLVERATGKGIVGNIYKGRVTRVLPGMQAAFVDIGLEKAAFLYVDDVYVHSEIWEEEEGASAEAEADANPTPTPTGVIPASVSKRVSAASAASTPEHDSDEDGDSEIIAAADTGELIDEVTQGDLPEGLDEADELSDEAFDSEDLSEESDGDDEPVSMGRNPKDPQSSSNDEGTQEEDPSGTVAPGSESSVAQAELSSGDLSAESADAEGDFEEGEEGEGDATGDAGAESGSAEDQAGRRRRRRGRRGGKNRRRGEGQPLQLPQPRSVTFNSEGQAHSASAGDIAPVGAEAGAELPGNYFDHVEDQGQVSSDRGSVMGRVGTQGEMDSGAASSEELMALRRSTAAAAAAAGTVLKAGSKPEFSEQRGKDRRIKSKEKPRSSRGQVNIQDLLQEGQEVLVQVAKDPIATKGARLTCHISLPGRHLVCMPTIDHVGVSRRIERDDERRKLREMVESYRPKKLGFIVRTASGKGNSEQRIRQDIDYLSRLWDEIRDKAASVGAPALVYEDLTPVLRAIRDWVNEDIDRIVVDSRYHFNDIVRFSSHFMPALKSKVQLYHGDSPIFDHYGLSKEITRSLERKVWLKSGGYIVIDQAEALVAIDVNTGRFVGKKNLEDTILKTNLEAVEEIAYQLRIRNCGGIIILDLIDMEKDENKQRVYRALEEALKKDRARPSILKISELGLVEMTRKRTRDTMVRTHCESCSHCEGKGFVKSKQTVAYDILREIERTGIDRDTDKILVQAHADVIDVLALEERHTIDTLERRYRKLIYLQAVADYHPEQFELSTEKGPRTERSVEETKGRGREREREAGREGGRDRGRGRDRDRGGRDRNRNKPNAPVSATAVLEATQAEAQEEGWEEREGREPMILTLNETPDSESQDEGGEQPSASAGAMGGRDGGRDFGRGRRDRGRGRDRNRDRDRERGANGHSQQPPQLPRVQPVQTASASAFDPDAIGNRIDGPAPVSTLGVGAVVQTTYSGLPQDDFFDEEDRLAFLRAQAAQDAALANLGASGALGVPGRGGFGGRGQGHGRGHGGGQGHGGGGGGAGGRRRRGRRGGGRRGGGGN